MKKKKTSLLSGTLWRTRNGNGFLMPEKEGEKDIFIPSEDMKGALHGDKIVARIGHSSRGKREGKIVEIKERKTKNITGYVKRARQAWYIEPDSEKIPFHFSIDNPSYKGLREGQLAACQVTRYPEEGGRGTCKIIKTFDGLATIKDITRFVVYKHALPLRFPSISEAEAKNLRPFDGDDKNRVDLRHLAHVTIDGKSAKDFDDALCIERRGDGYTLYVSIADVSHYVLPGSALDNEARERGTSVYFPGSVIPMLPRALSNIACSLIPRKDRPAMTVKLSFDRTGETTAVSFHPSLIRSAMRLTYTKVEKAVIDMDKKTRKELNPLIADIEAMKELAQLLMEKRDRRGSLDFDLPEPEVILDIRGGVSGIVRSERLFAHRIIEEFMIAANEAVARYLTKEKIPAIYRIHEWPDREKLQDFEKLLDSLPIRQKITGRGVSSLQAVLKGFAGTPYEFLINRTLLKSMKQARYSTSNKGHYGLASDCYLHFTSPIRRYPDLVCHRALKEALFKKRRGAGLSRMSVDELEQMAGHLTHREKVAMEAEREIEDRVKVLFMKDKLDAIYQGIISHIAQFGIFVELMDIFVEGVIPFNEMSNDYYIFQEEKFRVMGRRTKKIYRIGDIVRVAVVTADVEQNRLVFRFVK